MRRTALIALLLAITLAASSCGVLPAGVIYPSIRPDKSVTEDYALTVNFTFEHAPVSFNVTVDGSLYAGASAAEKSVTHFGGTESVNWIDDYYPVFVDEEHQLPFIDSLLAEFRAVRDARGLDADRYAELLTVFVQSIPYVSDPVDLSPKFPVETFVENAGDCDDKALLLAALLAREGYDVAILLFEPEKHVALGLRSAEIPYGGTGFAYIETTAPGFIGMVPDEFAGGVELTSEPRVIRVNHGELAYGAGAQVRAILDKRAAAIALAGDLEPLIAAADTRLSNLKIQLESESRQLTSLKSAGRIEEYNARVPAYNAMLNDYNDAAEQRNALAVRVSAAASVDSTVIGGLSDRPGTYAAVSVIAL